MKNVLSPISEKKIKENAWANPVPKVCRVTRGQESLHSFGRGKKNKNQGKTHTKQPEISNDFGVGVGPPRAPTRSVHSSHPAHSTLTVNASFNDEGGVFQEEIYKEKNPRAVSSSNNPEYTNE